MFTRNFNWRLLLSVMSLSVWLVTSNYAQERRVLSFGEVQEGTLKAREQHVYQISLAAGEFARVEVEATEPDINVSLFDAAGQTCYELDLAPFLRDQAVLYAQADMTYQIRLLADTSRTAPRSYRLRWLEKRTATELDKAATVAAQTAYEAERLYNLNTPAGHRQSVEKCRAAAQLYEQTGNTLRVAVMHNLMGLNLNKMGERAAAEHAYLQAAVLFRQLQWPLAENGVLDNLARLCTDWGDYQSAIEYASQKPISVGVVSNPVVRVNDLNGLALIYRRSGDLQRALALYLEAAEVARTNRQFFYVRLYEAQTMLGLGTIYCALGDETQGLTYLEKAVAANREMGFPHSPSILLADVEQAKVYLRRGEAQTVLDLLTPLLTEEGTPPFQRATVLTRLGQAYLALGRHNEAQGTFAQVEALSQTHGYQDLLIEALLGQTQVAHDQQTLSAAIALGEKTIALIERQQARIDDAMLRATLFASQREVYELQTTLLMQMSEQNATRRTEWQVAALHLSERSRARTLLNLLSQHTQTPQTVVAQKELRQKLEATVAELNNTPPSNKTRRDELKRTLTVLTTELNLHYTAQRKPADTATLVKAQALTLPELQQRVLDEKTLLLEYALGKERSYLFAVTPTALQTFVLPPRTEIEQKARALSQLLETRAEPPIFPSFTEAQRWQKEQQQQFDNIAAQLSQMLLAPVRDWLPHKRLLIVPDGALHYVPFAALPEPVAGGRWPVAGKNHSPATNPSKSPTDHRPPLIAQHELLTLPSASTLAMLRRGEAERVAAPKTLALFADPVFTLDDERVVPPTKQQRGETGAIKWARLSASRREAEVLATLVLPAQRTLALDFAAARTTVLQTDLRQYRYVHFATHGLLDNEHPELSALLLSVVDQQGASQNGYLRLMDVFNLRLNAELVVLSGCQTALGKEVNGEGLIGLTRGFMYAGARRVLASLWQVNDVATAELMRQFYQGMLGEQKLSPAAALRAAQLGMMRTSRWQSPYYWAAFTLQGEW